MKRTHLSWGTLLLLIAAAVLYYVLENGRQTGPPPPGPSPNPEEATYPHLRWGNPSGATADPGNRDNYLMQKKYYALSYNDTKGTPNWVSWRVVKEDLGDASREGLVFQPDDDLPPGFKRVVTGEYSGSGFDRGHMCPAADRGADMESLKATFVMTNVVPQSAANNRKGWEQFESYCRSLVNQGQGAMYIVGRPPGASGRRRRERPRGDAIAGGKVVVPGQDLEGRSWSPESRRRAGAGRPADRGDRHAERRIGHGGLASRYRVSVRAVEQADRLQVLSTGPTRKFSTR